METKYNPLPDNPTQPSPRGFVIAMDLDGVLRDFAGSLLAAVNLHYKTKFKSTYDTMGGVEEFLNSKGLKGFKMWNFIRKNPQIFASAELCIDGGLLYLMLSREKYFDIYIVTDQVSWAKQYTFTWLATLGFEHIKAIIFEHWSQKWMVNADLYIDDRMDAIDAILERRTAPVILWKRPWNLRYQPPTHTTSHCLHTNSPKMAFAFIKGARNRLSNGKKAK